MSSTSTVSYRVIGLGRAGRSLIRALAGTNWKYAGGYGRHDDPSQAAAGVDVVFIAVPDDAIAETACAIKPSSAVVVHLSGAKTLEVLEPHDHRASMHPLVSLPDPVTGAARLRDGATFAVAGHSRASDAVAVLGGRPISVDERHRSLYHATAAIAANHLVVLCAQVERLAQHIGVPVERYWDLMTATLENVERVGPLRALTGPAARGDAETIDAHIQAIEEVGPDEVDLYRTLADHAAELGRMAESRHGQHDEPH